MSAKRPLILGPTGPTEMASPDYILPELLPVELLDINNAADANEFLPLTVGGDDFRLLTGDDNGDYIGTPLSTLLRGILGTATQSSVRSQLGLGTAATENIGTSGGTVPKNDTANTWSATQTFAAITSTSVTSSGVLHSTSAGGINVRLFASDGDTAGYIGTTTAHDFKIMRNGNFVASFSASAAVFTGSVTSSGAASGVGYSTGAGGTVTQLTSKSTGVTLNRACGQITMNNATLNAGASVTFTLTNSAIAAADHLSLTHAATGTLGNYELDYRCAAGSATIYVRNKTAGNLSEAVVIGFAVIKATTS